VTEKTVTIFSQLYKISKFLDLCNILVDYWVSMILNKNNYCEVKTWYIKVYSDFMKD